MPFEAVHRQSFPYLVVGSNTQPVSWSIGMLLRRVQESSFVRITARGIQFHTQHESNLQSGEASSWNVVKCIPSPSALCEENSFSHMLYFDTQQINVPDDWELLMKTSNSFLQRFPNGSSCNSDDTGRTLKIGDTQYELSLCDLFDQNLDIIFFPKHDTLLWRINAMHSWEYVLLAIVSVYLIACLSSNLVFLLTRNMDTDKHLVEMKLQLILVSCILAYSCIFLLYPLVWEKCTECFGLHLITTGDFVLTLHLILLGILDTVFLYFSIHDVKRDHAANISLLTSCMLLLLVRVYDTMDTPYLMTLSCFFGARSIYKLLVVMNETSSTSEHVMQLCDGYVFCSLLGNGIWYQQRTETLSSVAQGQVLILSFLAGLFLYVYRLVRIYGYKSDTV